ncbi:MAG TPA: OmpA family protein [Thermoanaerobaculia bacterium]|jgi:outer membrane protein OmpA-like peptidoglycan-associated protein|nr:OmpA family protein [Thermoanaerobaculia bacterium]
MTSKRTVLLGMLICLTGAAAAFGQPAVIAPTTGGDVGLFTMSTADSPRAGQFTLGFYGWYATRTAGEFFPDQPNNTRYFAQWGENGSVGLGLTNWWSIFASFGGLGTQSGGGWQGGVINGTPIAGHFRVTEGQKIRLGTKISFHSESDPDLRFGVWLSGLIPVTSGDVTTPDGTLNRVNTNRGDWEWGGAVTKGWFTGMVSYTLAGQPTDVDVRVPNTLRFGFGAEVPVTPIIHVIAEVYYNVLDGGDIAEPDYGVLNTGARIWIGHTGWAVSAALSTNVSMLFDHGINPNPFGGLVGVTYAAWPPAPPPPVVVPAAAEPIVEQPAVSAPVTTTTATAPPPRPAPRTTSDEIFFDGKSARLTNIAKAVLDGVALRMKNDLNATAVITGYTDNTGTDKANEELGAKRAQAAREYLVTRHGIDPGRISTVSKGAAEPAYDNATAEGKTKNRRATILVTLVSGT